MSTDQFNVERKRAATLGNGSKSKKQEMNMIERHTILLKTVKDLGYDMKVFHLRWMPGDYLDKEILESVPMFWFKKFGWIKQDVEKLYQGGQIEITSKRKREMRHVFGKGKGKKRESKKDSGIGALSILTLEKQSSDGYETNTDDIYLRTRRLLKKVDAVPSSVRLMDNRSNMNIQNAGFPDLGFISSAQLNELAKETDEEDSKSPRNNTITPEDDGKSNNNNNQYNGAPNRQLSGDLKGIAEETEEEMSTPPNKTPVGVTPISSANNGNRIKSPSHRTNNNSMSTPFGDMDTNTMINLRAKHRRTSSLMNRHDPNEFSMKNYAEIVWNKLAVISGRGDFLTQRQFDIELQNNDILADPDICKELFKTIQSDEPVNKKQINKDDFNRVCVELDKIPLLDEIARDIIENNDEEKVYIVLKQVFVHIAQEESFNVSSFLTPKLTINDLNNVDLLLKNLSSREMEWTTRLQILKWITANLEESQELSLLTSDENIGPFLLGWMTQCLDERSNLAKGALEMFPNILSITMTQTGEAFQYLDDCFSSLFLVLRNKRSKDLTDTANECIIQCVDMIMDWHEHDELDNEVLLEVCHIFRDNTNVKEQKHDKVRERCVAYFGYIVYGIQGATQEAQSPEENISPNEESEQRLSLLPPTKSNHIKAKSADYAGASSNDDDDEKWVPSPRASIVGQKDALKISKDLKRKYLLNKENHAAFIEYMNDAINNGINDKSGDTRNTTFKLMEKLEKVEFENEEKMFEDIFQIDAFALSKFSKYKDRKNKSRGKGRKKKSNRQRIKPRNHLKKTSVTLTIGAQ